MFRHLLTHVYVCFTGSARLLAIKPNKNVSVTLYALVIMQYHVLKIVKKTMQKCTIYINHVHLYMYVSNVSIFFLYYCVVFIIIQTTVILTCM